MSKPPKEPSVLIPPKKDDLPPSEPTVNSSDIIKAIEDGFGKLTTEFETLLESKNSVTKDELSELLSQKFSDIKSIFVKPPEPPPKKDDPKPNDPPPTPKKTKGFLADLNEMFFE